MNTSLLRTFTNELHVPIRLQWCSYMTKETVITWCPYMHTRSLCTWGLNLGPSTKVIYRAPMRRCRRDQSHIWPFLRVSPRGGALLNSLFRYDDWDFLKLTESSWREMASDVVTFLATFLSWSEASLLFKLIVWRPLLALVNICKYYITSSIHVYM